MRFKPSDSADPTESEATEASNAPRQSDTAGQSKTSRKLQRTVRRVMRPLVRLLLSQGLPFQAAARLLKQVYVEVASEELDRSGKRPPDSRISLLTGIHRKEVKRLRQRESDRADVPKAISLGSQVIARWTSDKRFLTAEGRPAPLGRGPGTSASPSFDELVRSVSKDIHPRSILDEWQRLGIIELDDQERFRLLASAFVPRHGFEEKLFYFGRNVHDHLDATVRNLQGEEAPLLERSVHYGSLSSATVERLARFAEREGMKLLEEVNRLALELRSGDSADAHAEERRDDSERMNFGLYFYRGSDSSSDDVSPDESSGGEREQRDEDSSA